VGSSVEVDCLVRCSACFHARLVVAGRCDGGSGLFVVLEAALGGDISGVWRRVRSIGSSGGSVRW